MVHVEENGSCRTDQAIAPCTSLKPDIRMFRTYGNIHTHLSLLDEWSSQDSPTNSGNCRVFFILFLLHWDVSAEREQPYAIVCFE